jgi:hypothetical protein
VVALAVVVVAPQPGVARVGSGGFPVSWLWSWLAGPGAWSALSPPPTPVQRSGTAKGLGHAVPAAATRAGKGSGGPRGRGAGELSAYSPHLPAVASVASGSDPDRDRFDPRTSRRVASAAEATTDVYANADGSYTRRVYGGPVNYRAGDGSWQPIDASLGRGADGRWHQRANSAAVDFAGSADDPALVSVRPDGGHLVSYRMQG